MIQFILKENALSDDLLTMSDNGKVFKGGYIAFIKVNKFLNSWNDKEELIKFKSQKSLDKYLNKNYKNFQY